MKIAESQLQIVLDKAPFPKRNFCPSTVFHVFHPVGIQRAPQHCSIRFTTPLKSLNSRWLALLASAAR